MIKICPRCLNEVDYPNQDLCESCTFAELWIDDNQ